MRLLTEECNYWVDACAIGLAAANAPSIKQRERKTSLGLPEGGTGLAHAGALDPNGLTTSSTDDNENMRILVVDHEAPVANMLAESVRLEGHEAIVASSGHEALSILDQTLFHGMFLEIAMPEMSGIGFLRTIRKTHPSLPVIIITGKASPREIVEARRLGVTDVIKKPLGLRNLIQALQTVGAAIP